MQILTLFLMILGQLIFLFLNYNRLLNKKLLLENINLLIRINKKMKAHLVYPKIRLELQNLMALCILLCYSCHCQLFFLFFFLIFFSFYWVFICYFFSFTIGICSKLGVLCYFLYECS
jgi:hypothetical protein